MIPSGKVGDSGVKGDRGECNAMILLEGRCRLFESLTSAVTAVGGLALRGGNVKAFGKILASEYSV